MHISKGPFEYAHSDLWGPSRVMTHGGGSYFLTIIDDFSRKVWIHILKNKNDTFQKFREWHTLIENQKGYKLKVLRTDNGLEFVSEQFNEFCRKLGTKRHRTVAATPQQNGIAEMMNRTILEQVRCMLLSAGLPKAFWGEAATTAVYLINRCPSSATGFKTPIELWNGYPDDVKGYKLWKKSELQLESGEQKCIISRDVTFDETRMGMMTKDQKEIRTAETET